MKKNQFLKITLILVITFTTLLSSCSEDVYQENLIQKARDYHFKKINFQELKEINNQAFIETAKLKKVVPADKYNSIQSISNFDIDLQNIQYLKKTNNHETFSFRVLPLPNATFSQNIVVDCKPNQTPQTYLITYYLNKQLGQIDNTNEFINSITSTLTTKIDYSSNGNSTNSGGGCVQVGYYEEVDACEGELVTPGENPNCFNSDGSRKTLLVFKVIAADCSTGGSSSFNPLISQWDYNNGNTNSYNNSHGGGGESNESFNIFVPNYYNSGDLSDPSALNMIQINQFIYSLYSTNNDVRNVVESTEWLLAYTNYWIGINGGLTPENQNALTYAFNNIPSVFYQHYENDYNSSQISLFQYNALQLLIKHGEWLSNQDIQTQQNILQNINSIENIEFVDELIDGLINNPQPAYTITDYPGKNDGMPFEWWKDNDYMSTNFDVLEEDPNAAELLAFSLFPDKALLHIQNSTTALNKAQQLVVNNTLTGIEDGRADAFRHAYWNALGTAEFGSNITQIFTDAHEANSSGLPKQMDLHNNQKGREKAIRMSFNFFTSDSDIADSILIEVYVSHLLFILNGVLTPTN
jgi:hypothetical protein